MTEEIKQIAREAGKMMLEAGEKTRLITCKSGKGNFVTQFDVEIQNYVKNKLSRLIPQAEFMGEEAGADVYSDNEFVFIVDPIDGTTNFIRDYRHSCVSIGLLKDGKPYIGVVYNPYLNEMFEAKQGCGSYLNGSPIHVSDEGLDNALVSFGTAPYYPDLTEKTFEIAAKVFAHAADLRRCGSAALDICYVAAGRTDLFFELRISPWDFAASSLILTEAGGVIKTRGGHDIDFKSKYAVAAANPKAFDEFKKLVDF